MMILPKLTECMSLRKKKNLITCDLVFDESRIGYHHLKQRLSTKDNPFDFNLPSLDINCKNSESSSKFGTNQTHKEKPYTSDEQLRLANSEDTETPQPMIHRSRKSTVNKDGASLRDTDTDETEPQRSAEHHKRQVTKKTREVNCYGT